MPTECISDLFGFAPVEGRRVEASFDGGAITSDAGGLLLGSTDRAIGLLDRLAQCFKDHRNAELIEHRVRTLVGQRVLGLALGYEDLNDHDHLRHDPLLGVLLGKLEAKRSDCAPIAGKSTLNRLELSRPEPTKYHKISHDAAAIERLLVDLFMEAHRRAPRQIVLDLDATDDPLHGQQEGRFFHGYYDNYCYLPLYVTCGRHLLAAKLRRSNIDGSAGAEQELDRIVGQIRERWPAVRILVRADSGFARESLMAWCEAHGVHFLFGLARNQRLAGEIEQIAARQGSIDRITATITRIADKTQVLSINAGIEAARVGEQGRGFGVVAHEIGRLAEETALAAKDIDALILEAGQGVQRTVGGVAEARRTMERIAEEAGGAGTASGVIAAAISEQAGAVRLLSQRSGELRENGQSTAAAIEEISVTMEELARMAHRTRTEMSRFTLS